MFIAIAVGGEEQIIRTLSVPAASEGALLNRTVGISKPPGVTSACFRSCASTVPAAIIGTLVRITEQTLPSRLAHTLFDPWHFFEADSVGTTLEAADL